MTCLRTLGGANKSAAGSSSALSKSRRFTGVSSRRVIISRSSFASVNRVILEEIFSVTRITRELFFTSTSGLRVPSSESLERMPL